jgi:hypothetical protein
MVIWFIFIFQNLPSTYEETDEYSGDDEEVKQATTLSPDKSKTQTGKEKVPVLKLNEDVCQATSSTCL